MIWEEQAPVLKNYGDRLISPDDPHAASAFHEKDDQTDDIQWRETSENQIFTG
jgi:hypothetical protein